MSSTWARRRLPLGTITRSNSALRSLGTSTVTGPATVVSVLG